MTETDNRNELIERLVDNLPALRAKCTLTQSELADNIGIGRQTLMSIENKKSKMRKDTFIATIVYFSKNEKTSDFMRFLNLHLDQI